MEVVIGRIKFYGNSGSYKSLEDAVEQISKKHFNGDHKKEIESQISKYYGSDRPARNAEKAEKGKKGSENTPVEGGGEI